MALNLGVTSCQSLEISLDQFVRGEVLEGSNAYYCEKCKEKVCVGEKERETLISFSVCVCVNLCVRGEREKERETVISVCVCVCVLTCVWG